MDARSKKNLIQQNIYFCKFGAYRGLPILKTQKNFYSYNLNLPPPCEYCEVDVKTKHVLDTAYEYIQGGFKPAVVNIVSPEFTGENPNMFEGYRDEMFVFRTNINLTNNAFHLYPLKGTEVAYA